MPTYALIDIETPLRPLAFAVNAARKSPNFPAADWDAQIVAVLETQCALAEQHCRDNAKYTDRLRGEAQARLKRLEDKVKALTGAEALEKNTRRELEQAEAELRAIAKEAEQDNKRMGNALMAYRGEGWTHLARPYLSDEKLLTRFQAGRSKGMDVNKAANALLVRCGEYVHRAGELVRQALERAEKAAAGAQKETTAQIAQLAKEAGGYAKRIEAGSQAAFEAFERQKGLLTLLEKEMSSTKQCTDATLRTLRGRVMNAQAGLKSARGQLKTVRLQVDARDDWTKSSGHDGQGLIENWMKSANAAYAKAVDIAEKSAKQEARVAALFAGLAD